MGYNNGPSGPADNHYGLNNGGSQPPLKCLYCHKAGHRIQDCRGRMRAEQRRTGNSDPGNDSTHHAGNTPKASSKKPIFCSCVPSCATVYCTPTVYCCTIQGYNNGPSGPADNHYGLNNGGSQPPLKCLYCHKAGHRIQDCRGRMRAEQRRTGNSDPGNDSTHHAGNTPKASSKKPIFW
eukprot:jgi/Sobl393_1/20145/SZX60603.1